MVKVLRLIKHILKCIIKVFVLIYLYLWGVKVGKNLCISSFPICRRHKKAKIEIGSNVQINNKLNENLAGITHRTVLVASEPGAKLIIGNNVGISGVILFCTTEIILEDFVMLGADVRIYTTDFHPLNFYDRRNRNVTNLKDGSVHICHDAWIGTDAIILKGVTIGPRAVVAARSVVTRDVPADTLVAGIPARVVCQIENKEERI